MPKAIRFRFVFLGKIPSVRLSIPSWADATIDGKSVVAKRILTPQDASNCRVLFISSSEETRLKQILVVLRGTSALTVSDLPQFTQRGGMVQFFLEGNRVRFDVNLTTAEQAGLTLSSELLKVANNVRRGPRLAD
jgi:hypothetical protein